MDTKAELKKGLNRRHILFIALGSGIGTGLFYGSAGAIKLAGPSVLLVYAISGIIAFMVMRALGEMVLTNPLAGSFGRYAANYISPLAGFVTGWTYVFEMAVVCLADITAFATYMGFWYANVSPWVWTLGITLLISGVNLFSVKFFGELEFWLTLVKVTAIVAMICGGIAIMVYGMTTSTPQPMGIKNLWSYGGFFPNGWYGFLTSFSVVIFAFGGLEVVGLTAVETENADVVVPHAINAIPSRINLFYVMTIAVLLCLYPWNEIGLEASPFVTVFDHLGVTYAAHILNVVVIIASVSAINSDLYGAGRMLHGLAEEGYAVKQLKYISKHGVPTVAIFVMFCVLIFGVVLNYFFHDKLFFFIAAIATFATIFVWLMILISQFCMRLRLSKDGNTKLKFPIPFWPIGPIITIGFMIFIIVLLGIDEATQASLVVGLGWVAWLVICYCFLKKLCKI